MDLLERLVKPHERKIAEFVLDLLTDLVEREKLKVDEETEQIILVKIDEVRKKILSRSESDTTGEIIIRFAFRRGQGLCEATVEERTKVVPSSFAD